MPERTANHLLRKLMEQAGLGNSALAREVNQLGAQAGIELRYDRSTVSHWLAGSRPRASAIPLIVDALSGKLGKFLSPADVGFSRPTREDPPVIYDLDGDPLVALQVLTNADLDVQCRLQLQGAPYRTSGIAWSQFTADVDVLGSPQIPRIRSRIATDGQVWAIEKAVSVLCDLDELLGGGHAYQATTAYLRNDVLEALSGTGRSGRGQPVIGCAARSAQRIGIKNVDCHVHGLGQSYHLAALRVSMTTRDHELTVQILCDLANQATMLDYPDCALDFVTAAERLGYPSVSRSSDVSLLLQAQAAVVYAGLGDRDKALRLLDEIDVLRNSGTRETCGSACSYSAAVLAFRISQVHVKLNSMPLAVESLIHCLRALPPGRRRARTLATAVMAEAQMAIGRSKSAYFYWNRFLDQYQYIDSRRTESALRVMTGWLETVRNEPAAGQLLRRCEEYLTTTPTMPPDLPEHTEGDTASAS